MNNISVAGNISKDAETRFLQDGTPVASFSVADNQGKDKPAIFWNCQLFGKRAESLTQYLTKGQAVTVSGTVSQRTYTDKNGQERTSMDVRVNDVALQGGKREAEPSKKPSQDGAKSRQLEPRKHDAGAGGFADMDDDIPFNDPLKSRAYSLSI